jgi:two-component system chemotaxis response regulator CheY
MSKKILIVDDSDVARQELNTQIKAAGFITVEAENGRKGFEIAKAGGIALIISDVHMPEMSGIEMCEALFAELGANMPPALIVSTESSPTIKEIGKKCGVKGWVIKPVDTAKLIIVVKKLTGT